MFAEIRGVTAGKLSREGRTVEVRHVAEVLAGLTDDPPIGMARDKAGTEPSRPPPAGG